LVKDSPSEHSGQNLNARLLRFRSQPASEDAYALAEDLLGAKRYADARGVTAGAQPKDGEDAALLVLEGRAWLLERDMVRAQAVLLRAVRAAPELAEGYRWLGYVLLKRGDPQRAAKTLRRALALDPNDAEAAKLATRAEYLAEAANDSVVPEADISDEPPAQRVFSTPTRAAAQPSSSRPEPRPASGRARDEPRPASGRARDEQRTAPSSAASQQRVAASPPRTASQRMREEQRTAASSTASQRVREAQRTAPPSSTPPQVLRARPARETAPVVDPRDDRLEAGAKAQPKQPSAGPSDATRPVRGVRKPDEEPTSEFRRVPGRDSAGPQLPTLGSPAPPTRPGPTAPARDASGMLTMPMPRKGLDAAPARAPAPARSAPPPTAASSAQPDGPTVSRRGRQPTQPRALPLDYDPETQPIVMPGREESSAALEVPDNAQLTASSVPPPAAEDLALGSAAHLPADADEAFALVQRFGLFEANAGPAAVWSTQNDVTARGTPLRNALIGLWAFTLLACVGGYFGWQAFVAKRHAMAAQWVEEAHGMMLRGDHGALVDAERLLRLAREKHPASQAVPREALLLQVQRVLEDGERDLAALRSAFARARAAGVTGPVVSMATAVLSGFSGELAARDRALGEVLAGVQGDARLLYLVGRFEQRAGRAEALAHLQAAVKADPRLVPAQLALSEMALEAGDRDAALAQVDAALAIDREQLRARLFRLFLRADDADPAQIQKELVQLNPSMEKAGAIDRALEALVRARVLRRQGQGEAAGKAVEQAGNSGADEPRLLAWMAREALAVGLQPLAQHLASQALSAAPDVAQNRRLLARILIERNDGEHALLLLDKLPADDSEAQIMKAQAALLSNDEDALRAALEGLNQLSGTKREQATQVGALRVRLEAKLTPGRPVVDRARALVRSAPGDPEALLALAEAGLAAHDPATTQIALKQRFAVAPDDPNAHYLLGRARRMASDASGAEASFRRAIELAPGHGEALVSLAELLLDEGKYAEADAVYQELATRGGSAAQGRLGRVEALIGLGRLDDAQVQLDALPAAQQTSAGYRLSAARLALARGKPGDALTSLRPLTETQADKVSVMTLYGDALSAAEQLESAGGAYDAALAIDAELPEALLGRAEVDLRTNHVNEALPRLQKAKDSLAKRIRPPASQARRLTLLGHAYLMRNKRGDEEAARDALRDAIKLPGVAPEAYFWLAEACGARSSPEARDAYHRYLELEPRGRYQERAKRALQ
jgi:tetratricopeptide (TPR) repeat protein